jgi:hypothetical protein
MNHYQMTGEYRTVQLDEDRWFARSVILEPLMTPQHQVREGWKLVNVIYVKGHYRPNDAVNPFLKRPPLQEKRASNSEALTY